MCGCEPQLRRFLLPLSQHWERGAGGEGLLRFLGFPEALWAVEEVRLRAAAAVASYS
ncbi:MAG: hypothetical protein KatS3mg048_3742 [Caldilinea sp.]|nr:MAG: hypothetical protein KatS3mg048_3742 [Caldilinea sp.]